jgi:hypothetical protein
MMPGVPERRTHSYVRDGTTSLFAALDVASGFVIGKMLQAPPGSRVLRNRSLIAEWVCDEEEVSD